MNFAVIYEKTSTGYSAYVPDLPGCIAAGATFEETAELIRGAIEIHLESLREDGPSKNHAPRKLTSSNRWLSAHLVRRRFQYMLLSVNAAMKSTAAPAKITS